MDRAAWSQHARLDPLQDSAVATTELAKPLYTQVYEYLAERIFSGALPPDTKLSERELSRELEISRMTARRALTELVNEGLLIRRHGAGTFVAKPKATYAPEELVSFSGAMRSRGFGVTSQLLEFSIVPAGQRLASVLGLDLGAALFCVVRLRLANRVPSILERCYLPQDRFPDLHEYDLERTSIHDILEQVYGLRPGRIDETIEAVTASDILSRQLRIEEGFPLLLITRTTCPAGDDTPMEHAQAYLRSDYARLRLEVRPSPGTVMPEKEVDRQKTPVMNETSHPEH
jgi:GntR family transcriptional regulator